MKFGIKLYCQNENKNVNMKVKKVIERNKRKKGIQYSKFSNPNVWVSSSFESKKTFSENFPAKGTEGLSRIFWCHPAQHLHAYTVIAGYPMWYLL